MEKFDCNRECNTKDHWNLKKFIVSIIKVIGINVNPIVTKVTLNSLITLMNNFSTDFAGKVY